MARAIAVDMSAVEHSNLNSNLNADEKDVHDTACVSLCQDIGDRLVDPIPPAASFCRLHISLKLGAEVFEGVLGVDSTLLPLSVVQAYGRV